MTDRLVSPGSEISPDTHVGSDFDRRTTGAAATPSPARPDALVEHNRVSRGDELEGSADDAPEHGHTS